MPMFRHKPVTIEAVRFDGTNSREILLFTRKSIFVRSILVGNVNGVFINGVLAVAGDWVIKDAAGEFRLCKPDVFEATYEPVSEETSMEECRDHLCAVTVTREVGLHSGRRRYRVVCRTCRVVVHPATTGPRAQMSMHADSVERDGHPTPFPGTAVGVVE